MHKGRVPLRFNTDVIEDTASAENNTSTARMTAYFALISLAHVHVLLGDYQTALEVITHTHIHTHIPAILMFGSFRFLVQWIFASVLNYPVCMRAS